MSAVIQMVLGSILPPTSYIFESDGSTLAGWTNNSATVNNSMGLPAPSLESQGGQYAYYNIGESLLGKTIELDMLSLSGTYALTNFFFACNSSGAGQLFRLECRDGYNSGFAPTDSWTSWGGPDSVSNKTADVWYHIKIEISLAGNADAYIDGDLVQSTYSISNNGNYIAIHGDGGVVEGGLYDNIIIY